MADHYLDLETDVRREALEFAASESGRPAYLLEKDIWVVWTLRTLFGAPVGASLVFKGGTSLSKAYGVIRRFSEDVDLTYDIRDIVPDLIGNSAEPLPANRSQEKRWSAEIRRRLAEWTRNTAAPYLAEALGAVEPGGTVRIDDADLFVRYAPLNEGTAYVRPEVKLEFGARSTGEPSARMPVICDAAALVPGVEFPEAEPRVMQIERTFWEKATAAHVYCLQHRLRGARFARHWHDLARLGATGHVDSAVADREIAEAVAAHKTVFFREKDVSGNWVDYEAAVSGRLELVPTGPSLAALADDYTRMVDDGLLLDDAEPFDALMHCCQAIANRANQRD